MYGSMYLFVNLRLFRLVSVLIIFSLLTAPGIGYARLDSSSKVFAPNPAQSILDGTINSAVPALAPRIDGLVSEGEWSEAAPSSFPYGTLHILNDLSALYLLVDLTSETKQNASGTISLTFDVNNNAHIDSGVDVKLSYAAGAGEACLYPYSGPDTWTGCQPTGSIFHAGWGPTPSSTVPHRFYEIAASLAEISPSAALFPRPDLPDIPSALHMGIQVAPSLSTSTGLFPSNHQADFSQLLKIPLDQTEIKLLILGHTDDMSALQVLDAHKDHTGMPSYLLDWVVVAQLNQSIGYDDPERIKKAIATYENNWNISYALLVGDANRFPMRYTITDREDDPNHRAHWAYYSADLYYADLYEADQVTFEDWDANDDHYYGELHGSQIAGIVNVDQVDLVPDIAVGRVPASDTAEVTTFVNKVINYEFNAYKTTWHKKALMIATMDWIANACQTKEYIRNNLLIPAGYLVGEYYQAGNPCMVTLPPTQDYINYSLSVGFGFVNYDGHGNRWGWAIPDYPYVDANLALLTNQNMLPITVATGCDTGRYTTQPPYDAYTDVNGAEHIGTNAGEIFLTKPIQPSPIQANHNLDAFAEEILVKRSTGAVAYIGFVTGSQVWAEDLDKAFFESLTYNRNTLGGMWNYMVNRYYQWHPDPGSLSPPDWLIAAGFHQPWKFHLFGDPSLRIDGVPRLLLPIVRR